MPLQPWRVAPLRLPISDDLTIDISPLNWEDGMTLRQMLEDGGTPEIPADADADELAKLCVGPDSWLVMRDAKPSFAVANRVTQAAVQYQVTLVMGQSSEAAIASAEKIWEAGLHPEAIAAVIAAAQAASMNPAAMDSTSSTSTDADSETPSPASTSSTKSPTATRRTSPKKKAASGRSRGTSSSAAGSSSAPTSPPSTESASSDTPS